MSDSSSKQIAHKETTTGLPSQAGSVFGNLQSFEEAQRMAGALVSSDMVPKQYQGRNNIGNAMIALEMSQRMGASVMAVMQNLHVIEGRPGWSSPFIIAALNSCGRFSPLRFQKKDLGKKTVQKEYWTGEKGNRKKQTQDVDIHDMECVAWAYDLRADEKLEGPRVTIEMAVQEGWYTRPGSKWRTMPELMLHYRAAAFFGRMYASDVLMGMQTQEEVEDVVEKDAQTGRPVTSGKNLDEALDAELEKAASVADGAPVDAEFNDSGEEEKPKSRGGAKGGGRSRGKAATAKKEEAAAPAPEPETEAGTEPETDPAPEQEADADPGPDEDDGGDDGAEDPGQAPDQGDDSSRDEPLF